jgi:hypothetical protein
MSPKEISALADKHILAWNLSPPNGRGLRAHVADAISEALATDYEQRCRHGTPPHDINNPPFQRHCAPQHDSQ